ncbi:GL19051 [Drosophila persimilis]|uniref:GL19051 n=1 Tax=Drosophila persimilis TaxID=7234 RepID=B4G6K5_DROPE|nr:GL19051 [Drosophila persimilis]
MRLRVVFGWLVLSMTTYLCLAWSDSDPVPSMLSRIYNYQKHRNLAKVKILPQKVVSFVGPRQAGSSEEEQADDEYDDYEDWWR